MTKYSIEYKDAVLYASQFIDYDWTDSYCEPHEIQDQMKKIINNEDVDPFTLDDCNYITNKMYKFFYKGAYNWREDYSFTYDIYQSFSLDYKKEYTLNILYDEALTPNILRNSPFRCIYRPLRDIFLTVINTPFRFVFLPLKNSFVGGIYFASILNKKIRGNNNHLKLDIADWMISIVGFIAGAPFWSSIRYTYCFNSYSKINSIQFIRQYFKETI